MLREFLSFQSKNEIHTSMSLLRVFCFMKTVTVVHEEAKLQSKCLQGLVFLKIWLQWAELTQKSCEYTSILLTAICVFLFTKTSVGRNERIVCP